MWEDVKCGTFYTDEVNIIRHIYQPGLKHAGIYIRDTGSFSSNVYYQMGSELLEFLLRDEGNHMTLICSMNIRPEDINALYDSSYEISSKEAHNYLRTELNKYIETGEKLSSPVKMLVYLINAKKLSLVINLRAQSSSTTDHSHSKSGIFEIPSTGEVLYFTGTVNETFPALEPELEKGNAESYQVYHKKSIHSDYDLYISPTYERLKKSTKADGPIKIAKGTISVPIKFLSRSDFPTMKDGDWDAGNHKKEAAERSKKAFEKFERISTNLTKMESKSGNIFPQGGALITEHHHLNPISGDKSPLPFPLRDHQASGLNIWKDNGYNGILKHATGSGKTITSIMAIDANISEGNNAIVLVPSDPLLNQWDSVFDEYLPHVTRGLLGGGNKDIGILDEMTVSADQGVVLISTIQSFRNKKVIRKIDRLLESVDQPLLLVVDECHKIGAPSFSEICTKSFPKKLGLSATPERQGDSEGTARIFGFLGPVIDEYTLKDAIKDGHLSTFRYNISTVNLTPLEQNHYDILREKIRQALRFHKEGQPLGEYLESLIFASRRIIRGAEEKIPETLRILKENFEPQHHWLIYCDTSTMMDDLSDIIYQRLNYRPLNYDSRLSPNKRQLILNHFEENGGVILAIKCLDEGVDIPAISHGIVLSSSKTKREWIQRRGRLLRKSTNKEYSVIFDVLALPDESGDETSFVMDEIKRSLEFSEAALNYKKISFEIDRLRRQYDIKLEDIHETEETPRTEDVSNNGSPHGK